MTRNKKACSPANATGKGLPSAYVTAFAEIKDRVRAAQYAALKSVNKQLVGLYWDIGRIIVEGQTAEGWGRSIVERLSADLRQEFPGVGGFSVQNLWYMRQFYEEYQGNKKLQPLVGEIAWAHNLVIMSKCKDPLEREFYLRMTRKFGWSKNVLIHQIENQSYEKSLLGQTNFDKAPTNKPIGAATCEIVKRLPKALKGQFLNPEPIAKYWRAGYKTSEKVCFSIYATPRCTICARAACIINKPIDLNAEAVQLATIIMDNFEEMGV